MLDSCGCQPNHGVAAQVKVPVRFLISCRRILYFQTILKRPENELTRRVLKARQQDVLPGDFIQLVQEDLKLLRSDIDESYILKTSKKSFKTEVKKKIRQAS